MSYPFNDLIDLIEGAVAKARGSWDPSSNGTENGMIAYVVSQELRRSGYKIIAPTGYSYPPDDLRQPDVG